MTDTPTNAPMDPLSVRCPICDAAPGQRCENTAAGWIVPADQPHLTRIAGEVGR